MKYLLGVIAFLLPLTTSAAAITLTPVTLTVSKGERFSLALRVLPDTTPIYTASVHLSFDPKLVQETQFTPAPSWLALTQPGYDSVDNTRGILIKTAGYPGGIGHETPFGSITFEALETGTTTLLITRDSVLLDSSSTNQLMGTAGLVLLTIQEPHTVAAPGAPTKTNSSEQNAVPAPSSSTSTLFDASSSLAAVGGAQDIPWSFIALVGAFLFFISSLWIRFAKHGD